MSTAAVSTGKRQFGVINGARAQEARADTGNTRADALFFRAQTMAIVRHFFEISCQIGRLPSILGREFFRAKVSHHGIPSFEEQALFVHDVERAMGRLNEQDSELVSMVGLFQYSMDDVAFMLGCSRGWVTQHYADAVDRLAELFLEAGLLREDRPDRHLRRFAVKESPPEDVELPPKKPAASVGAEACQPVAEGSARYSFVARPLTV
jgi:hypothetical protein